MEMIVEIGEPKDQEVVNHELSVFFNVVEKLEIDFKLNLVVVAEDFDKTVNTLEKKTDYRSHRGLGESAITSIARVVHLKDGFGIVLSPRLYMEDQDTSTRYFTLFHELMHVVNRHKYEQLDPEWSHLWLSQSAYQGNLYRLWDEYSADHFAYKFVNETFPIKSAIWDNMILLAVEGSLSLLNDITYYHKVKYEIDLCRMGHRDLKGFFGNIHQSFDEIAGSTVHAFSLLHQYPEAIRIEDLRDSEFINDKTINLMQFYRSCADDPDMELKDGLPMVAEYLTNFGYTMVDEPDGTHVRIVDI